MRTGFCVREMLLFFVFAAAVACGDAGKKNDTRDTPETGSINISVDESFKPVIEEQIRVHKASFPKANIQVSYKSEAACFRDLQNDSTRMIIVAKGLTEKEAESYKSVLSYKPQYGILAYDAVAVIVNNEAKDSIFTIEKLKDILGGKNNIIAVMDGKSATSTVRFLQDSVLKGAVFGANVAAVNNSSEVIDLVSKRADVIGFVGLSWIGDSYDPVQRAYLKKIRLARVECTACLEKGLFAKPSQATITYGEYPLARPLYYILKENAAGLGTGFMNFMSLERGQLIFRRAFLAPAKMAFQKRNSSIKKEKQTNYKKRNMKKIVALMFAALVSGMMASAQIAEGVKLLNYEKNKTARALFQKSYDANPKDPQSIYWLGQAILAGDGVTPAAQKIAAAKALYQKGLQDIGSDPLLVVGMGHIEVLEGGDLNSAKQKFEQAITATTETKGKNKGKVSPLILNAIGRANADGGSKVGDPVYAIEKLKLAKAYDPANTDPNIPDIFINMGINYLKLGGENGGEAVKAYEEAIAKDPKNALAYYRIGKIYLSQNNKEIFDQYFDKAIQADPTFPQVYYSLFDYYANRDVNKAKEYLDKYIANAEKDPKNDLYLAEYLFRAGRYQESLDKLKELDNTVGIKALPGLGLIYAYDYDRLGDSVSAKKYIQDYIDNTPTEKLRLPDYELALKIVAKFPGNEAVASGYVEKALVLDTVKKNQIDFMDQAAAIFGKAKIYPEQLKWMKRKLELKGALSEADHYSLTNAAMNAKEYAIGLEFARNYLNAYPDKPQPANFFRRAAIALDPDSTKGTAIEHLAYLNTILEKDLEKNKTAVFRNNYYTLVFYVNKFNNLKKSPDFKVKSDGTKTEVVDQFLATCQKAVEVTDKMIALFPDATSDENKFATEQKNSILKNIDYYSKPPAKQPAGGGKGNGTPSPKK